MATTPTVGTPVLSLEGVSVALGGRTVLNRVSVSFAAGEFIGLIGSNGAGKTTLIRAVLGLVTPFEGSIQIDGSPRHRTSTIGYVPQKLGLEPDVPLRARDLIGLGLDGQRLGVPLPSKKRRGLIDEMIDAVDAGRFADQRVGALSGGEQQRVMLAHAMIGRPKLLLLDEPLANLDLRSEQEIVDLVDTLRREHEVTVLMSAHDVNPLLGIMDRVAYFADGRVACGPTDEVVTTEALSELYGHHVDVIEVHDRVIVIAGRSDVERHAHEEEPRAVTGH
jgi:zinc/manganese transport system ATP-binding protein